MSIKARWKAPMSTFGQFLHDYGAKGLSAVAAVGELTNFLGMMPADLMIPNWLRLTIWGCAGLSYLVSKLTVEKKKDGQV